MHIRAKNKLKIAIKTTTDTLNYFWAPKDRETNIERANQTNMQLQIVNGSLIRKNTELKEMMKEIKKENEETRKENKRVVNLNIDIEHKERINTEKLESKIEDLKAKFKKLKYDKFQKSEAVVQIYLSVS
jgi:predicted RNase H-like nuclease (RuvC/YqgF family)